MRCKFCNEEFEFKYLLVGTCFFCLDECTLTELEDLYVIANKEDREEIQNTIDRRFPQPLTDLNDFHDTDKERE